MRARQFDSVEFQAIAWLVNQQLNPRGFHFSVIRQDDLEPVWIIQGDGSEVAGSVENEDLLFRLLKELLEESTDFYKENHAGT